MTIDPHKLGYVPYPAGAFLLRDRRAHELVATDPPYPADKPWARVGRGPVLSRFVFDGSKPGAAATAVWLSDKVLPLDERDHCCLIERTVCGAVMDPFLGAPEAPDHIDGLIAALRRGAEECFEELDLRHRSFGSG